MFFTNNSYIIFRKYLVCRKVHFNELRLLQGTDIILPQFSEMDHMLDYVAY